MPYSLIKTEVMRQVCFLFGIPSPARPDVRKADRHAVYCGNTCILRPAAQAPDDWMTLTRDRLRFGPLCVQCEAELRQFFKDCAGEREEAEKC